MYIFANFAQFFHSKFVSSDNVVYLWRMGEGGGASNTVSMDTGLQNKESWSIAKMLR